MRFTPTAIAGAFLVEPEPHGDARGTFARTFDAAAFRARGLETHVELRARSYNPRSGTLRGLHYQAAPYEECKLVSCCRGAAYDVIADVRPESPTYRRWFATELTSRDGRMLYVPRGVAHGFQTLADGTELHYLISAPYAADAVRGVRFDDPAFAIDWPPAPRTIAERDRAWPDFASR